MIIVRICIVDELKIVDITVARSVEVANSLTLRISHVKFNGSQNLTELLICHFISAEFIPVLEKLFDVESRCQAEIGKFIFNFMG